jgi:rhodanese-related sulfurtransferase
LGGDVNASDFAGYMNNLGLPHPRLMDIAVPANLRCGRPDGAVDGNGGSGEEPSWAALTFTFSGIWEIQPTALEEGLSGAHGSEIQIIDVREGAEFSDALGHLHNARLLPLSQLAARSAEIDRQRPVVTVCRSGARSAQAVVMLQKAGWRDVANLAGGMLRWRAESLPVDDGAD